MPVDLAEMMEMVVDDLVVLVDILGAGAVSEQEDARAAEVIDLIARDDVPLAMEIEPDGFAAAIEEPAVLDPAFFRSAQAKQPVSLVDHRPVVLNRHGVVRDDVPVALGEGDAFEHDAADGGVRRPFDVDVALHANEFHQGRREDLVSGLVPHGPEVEFLFP